MRRGHDVTILCAKVDASPKDLKLVVLPNRAFFNHNHNLQFSNDTLDLAGEFDVIAGFNKLPNLDILYCADPVSKQPKDLLQRVNPRIRGYIRLDLTCFGPQSSTKLLLLAEPQWELYHKTYGTDPARAEVLPPTVERSRAVPAAARASVRAAKRQELGIADSRVLWMFVGSYPAAKGLDRIIEAMQGLPDVECLCVGFDLEDPRHGKLLNMARSAGVLGRLRQLGRRTDIPELMVASDLLVHPSRKDVTGTVILEAMINELPVITTAACGYSGHVTRAGAGVVVSSDPFDQAKFHAALAAGSDPAQRQRWQGGARSYINREDLYSGLDRAALAIEEAGARKKQAS